MSKVDEFKKLQRIFSRTISSGERRQPLVYLFVASKSRKGRSCKEIRIFFSRIGIGAEDEADTSPVEINLTLSSLDLVTWYLVIFSRSFFQRRITMRREV